MLHGKATVANSGSAQRPNRPDRHRGPYQSQPFCDSVKCCLILLVSTPSTRAPRTQWIGHSSLSHRSCLCSSAQTHTHLQAAVSPWVHQAGAAEAHGSRCQSACTSSHAGLGITGATLLVALKPNFKWLFIKSKSWSLPSNLKVNWTEGRKNVEISLWKHHPNEVSPAARTEKLCLPRVSHRACGTDTDH